MLDYWANVLYRAELKLPDVILAPLLEQLEVKALDDSQIPYPGLEEFQEKQHDVFCGRQNFIDKLVNHLRKNQLLVLIGSPGVIGG